EEGDDTLSACGGGEIRKARVVVKQFAGGQIIVEIGLLGEIADLPVHSDIVNRTAANSRRTGSWENQSREQLESGGFAGTVRSQETEDFPVLNLKLKVIERPAHALAPEADRVVLGEPEDFDSRSAHRV